MGVIVADAIFFPDPGIKFCNKSCWLKASSVLLCLDWKIMSFLRKLSDIMKNSEKFIWKILKNLNQTLRIIVKKIKPTAFSVTV